MANCIRLLVVGLFLFVVANCSEQEHQHTIMEHAPCQSFLFNMQQYFSGSEYNMSFPIWFNDTVLKQQKVKGIIVKVFPSSRKTDVRGNSPKQKKSYLFDQNGEVTSVVFDAFYENTNVGSSVFKYTTTKDENGFSQVEEQVNPSLDKYTTKQYSIYEKVGYGKKALRYRDRFSGNQLFYMLDKKNWGALSVDSILNPKPVDKVVLGTPFIPHKSYRVENLVKEMDGINFEYDRTGNFVQKITYDIYPFKTKRSINYTNHGVCTGFVDSMFSKNEFMSSSLTSFEMQGDLPVKILRKTRVNESQPSSFYIETIEYLFWEAN